MATSRTEEAGLFIRETTGWEVPRHLSESPEDKMVQAKLNSSM